VKWSPDGKHIVFAAWDGSVQERDVTQERDATTDHYSFLLRPQVLMKEMMITTAWKEDLSLFAFGGTDRRIEVADLVNGNVFLCRGSTMPVELIGQRNSVLEAEAVIQKTTSIATDTTTTTTTETIQPGPAGPRVLHSSIVQRRTINVWGGHDERDIVAYYGHLGAVKGVAWSPDGTRIASASYDGTIQVWDAVTRATIFTLRGHTDPVVAVAWSPDGQRLASGSLDKTAKVWDVLTGQAIQTYRRHKGFVPSVTWSPDGKHVASGSEDHEIHIWDAATGETLLVVHVHSAPVTAVGWSPDGCYLASGGEDQIVQVQEIATNTTVFAYRGHHGVVQAVAWSPDSKRIASGGNWNSAAAPEREQRPEREATLHIWSATGAGDALLCSDERPHTPVGALTWSPDGTMVAAARLFAFVEIYDAATGEKTAQISNTGRQGRQHGRNLSLAWSPDGTRIAAGSSTGEVKIWRTG
jgi:WD40 repeat protein